VDEARKKTGEKLLVLGSRNRHKVGEMRVLLGPIPFEVCSLDDVYDGPDVVEDGSTFLENAVKKACELSKRTGKLVLADDSGLEVDALRGAPGVMSARYSGPAKDDADNNRRVLEELRGVPRDRRTARFVCVVAAADKGRVVFTAQGTVEGIIAESPRGSNGFGYDPVFFVPSLGKTFGQVPPETKNRLSHRASALAQARAKLLEYAGSGLKR